MTRPARSAVCPCFRLSCARSAVSPRPPKVQSPAVAVTLVQMFSGAGAGGAGGGAGGGGGGLAGMMNAMAPLMGDLLGGLGGAGEQGSSCRGWSQRVERQQEAAHLPLMHGRAVALRGNRPPLPVMCLLVCQRPSLLHAFAGGRPGSRAVAQPPASLEEVLARELPPEEAARWKAAIEADEQAQQAQLGGAASSGFSDAYLAALPPRAAAGLLQLADDDEEEQEGAEPARAAAEAGRIAQ